MTRDLQRLEKLHVNICDLLHHMRTKEPFDFFNTEEELSAYSVEEDLRFPILKAKSGPLRFILRFINSARRRPHTSTPMGRPIPNRNKVRSVGLERPNTPTPVRRLISNRNKTQSVDSERLYMPTPIKRPVPNRNKVKVRFIDSERPHTSTPVRRPIPSRNKTL